MKKTNKENVGGMGKCKMGKNGHYYSVKDPKKRLVVGELKAVIKDIIKKTLEELGDESIEETSVSGGVSGPSTPYAFGKSRKDLATVSMPGFKVVGGPSGGLEEKKKSPSSKPVLVPVGKEKNPDIVKDPKHRGVNKDDLYKLTTRRAIANSLGDVKKVEHYDVLIGLAKKELKMP
jgi:hypothetical protein